MSASRLLNPAQEKILAQLQPGDAGRPSFDADLADNLRAEANAALGDLIPDLDPFDPMFVSKHQLSSVLGCQVRFLGEEDLGFAWSVPMARGSVAHKALELSNFMPEASPIELVNQALTSLVDTEQSIGDFLASLSELESAELRGLALDSVSAFFEGFPPLKPKWRPNFESRRRVELLDGRLVWSAKFDLTLGQSRGLEAGKAIIDFKTGGTNQNHVDDLRFYALVETLRFQVPPRLVASYYLDSGELAVEEVTVAVLEAALARALHGTREVFGLLAGVVEPRLAPSRACRWCPLLAQCQAGREFLAEVT
ncbi:MAG: PD-(D/E)XK nuclease family protein [Acidimicrobiia bacterium]